MIANETLQKLATQYQTGLFPNVIREYFQHVFLSELYKLPESENMLFKGGAALRIIYGSPRFSEDLDFSVFQIADHAAKRVIEDLLLKVLAEIERIGIRIEIGQKSGKTSGGYFGVATFTGLGYHQVGVEVNVSTRNSGRVKGEVDTIASDFVPTYTLVHLPQEELVKEKIFGALRERKKPRDFYDLYFMMRRNMLSAEHKKRLGVIKETILADAKNIDFRAELGAFLPAHQQAVVRDFHRALTDELNRQIS